jgi:pectate disaccharide-lyase
MNITRLTLSISAILAMAGCSSSSPLDNHHLTWQSITFGQSTDLNFGSTILPEKIGVNQVTENGILLTAGPLAKQFTIESRGGKIANSHEGVTFYYTKLPTNVNFVLSATVKLDQLGPETGSKPNRQEGAGMMVRDIIGTPRLNPQPEGLEEFPAASNMVMNLLLANKKENNSLINITAAYREGIESPWGTAHNKMVKKEVIKGIKFGTDNSLKMTLERTNSGYRISSNSGNKQESFDVEGANANIIGVQDPDHQYVGFFASRNAKMTVSDVQLTLTDAHTIDAPKYHPTAEPVQLQQLSATQSAIDDYIVQFRSNYSGSYTIYQDGALLVKEMPIVAGENISYPTHLNHDSTDIQVVFNANQSRPDKEQSLNYSVKKVNVKNPMRLSVNPTGSAGKLDLASAITLLPPGGTIILEDGDYSGITIPTTASGTAQQLKTLQAAGHSVRFTGSLLHNASYWNISNIEVLGAQFIVHGSYNNFDNIVTHDAPDTGFQITSSAETGKALWASHNIVRNSESYNNMDDSQINADGFAAKMRIGDGNTFIHCIAHHNIDDGWDLFNKVEDGPNGAVTILDSISYMNGQTMTVATEGGTRGNGFKLGGEGLPVAHVVKNSLAFRNNMDGFTDNFNPGPLLLEKNVAIDNKRFNFLFRKSPYSDKVKQGTFNYNESLRFFVDSQYSDVVNSDSSSDNIFITNGVSVDQNGKPLNIDTWLTIKQQAKTASTKSEVLKLKQLIDTKSR